MENTSRSSRQSGDSVIASTASSHEMVLSRIARNVAACMYAGLAISAVLIVLAGILFFSPTTSGTASYVMIFSTIAIVLGGAVAWISRLTARSIKELFSAIEAREKKNRSDLSHDIRNKLAIIKTDTEIALMDNTSKNELKETLERIMAEADKINARLNGS